MKRVWRVWVGDGAWCVGGWVGAEAMGVGEEGVGWDVCGCGWMWV